ncbi:MAG: hypothetical protein HQ472_04930 [Ignavibacteria bacterium]|nr:hypothetical protein [Ignavibacteria bacterium]
MYIISGIIVLTIGVRYTVAHGGSSASGSYAFTLNLVDIATGWTIQRALWGKGQRSCHEAIQDIETVLPFRLKGFDSDNGSEFLNYHLMSYFTDRKQPVEYTRSRPYVKNDNAHIEQKNWTHVRQYLGYQRFDHPEIVPLMNDLYSNELYLFTNFFIPSFKLLTKHREGAHVLKTHDKPKTPFQRLLDSQTLTARKRKELIKINRSLNPFQLQLRIVHKVNAILAFAGLNRVHPDSQ